MNTIQELLAELMAAPDQASRRTVLAEALDQDLITGDFNELYDWVMTNEPDLLVMAQMVESGEQAVNRNRRVLDEREAERERQANRDSDAAQGASDFDQDRAAQARGDGQFFTEPPWLLDELGRELTPEEKDRWVRHVRVYYGMDVTSFEELASIPGYMDTPTDQVVRDFQAAVSGVAPVQALTFNLPNSGDIFTVKQSEWESAQISYGVNAETLIELVNLADRAGIRGADGKYIAWQPLTAWMKSIGMLDEFALSASARADRDLAVDQVGNLPPEKRSRSPLPTPAGFPMERPVGYQFAPSYAGVPGNVQREPVLTGQTTVRYFEQAYARGLELYGNDAMAWVHTISPVLANRVSTGRATGMDARLLARHVANAGFNTPQEWFQGMATQGFAEFAGEMFVNALGFELAEEKDPSGRGPGAGDGPGGAGATQRVPDPAGLDETLRQLYMQMFDAEPDEATLARFRSQINAAASSDSLGSVDITARARQFAREDPAYDDLYSNRPEGMLEEEYRGMFEAGQQSMLGNELAGNMAVRQGMRSGKYQTTIGAAAGSAEAWDNSTFLGRLARAANVVGANT